jgi:hypothetical protein
MKQVDCFRLGVDIDRPVGKKSEIKDIVSKGENVSGALMKI